MLEAPLITESALEVIRKYCEDEVRTGGRSPATPSIMVQAGGSGRDRMLWSSPRSG